MPSLDITRGKRYIDEEDYHSTVNHKRSRLEETIAPSPVCEYESPSMHITQRWQGSKRVPKYRQKQRIGIYELTKRLSQVET